MLPEQVRIVEVGPRDGLQNEQGRVRAEDKIALVDALGQAGIRHIEAGSFVSSRWVPQMADSATVFAGIERLAEVTYAALTPNLQGLEAAIAAGASEVAVFAAASESFSQRNINCSIAQSLARFEPLMALAAESKAPAAVVGSCPESAERSAVADAANSLTSRIDCSEPLAVKSLNSESDPDSAWLAKL